ncbi:MAG: hypothetical protein O6951_08985 [Actinobacteria bacterium]|nr:hypothetical protein [Actinomycetota bacterium]
MTTAHVAEMMHCTGDVRDKVHRKELPAMRWGHQSRFFRDEVIATMQRVDDSDELEEVWAAANASSARPGGVSRKLPSIIPPGASFGRALLRRPLLVAPEPEQVIGICATCRMSRMTSRVGPSRVDLCAIPLPAPLVGEVGRANDQTQTAGCLV